MREEIMQRYREKIVEVTALQIEEWHVREHLLDGKPLPAGLKVASAEYHRENRTIHGCILRSGSARAKIGDYIVMHIDGTQTVCKPDEFAKKYEPVEVYP